MKKFFSIILVLALVLGFIPSIAPVNAVAAGPVLNVDFQSAGTMETQVASALTNGGGSKSNYTSVTVNVSIVDNITGNDWLYLRRMFDPSSGLGWTLQALTINGSSLRTIGGGTAVTQDTTVTPNWKSITLPTTITTIDRCTFRNSVELTTFEVPKSVTGIGTLAFAGCVKLSEIKVASGNTKYTSNDGILYTAGMSALVVFPAGKSGGDDDGYTIKAVGVSELALGSFADVKIKKLTISTGVKTISGAFVKTPNTSSYALTSIYFNASSPPTLSKGSWSTMYDQALNYNDITVYVPATSQKLYKDKYNGIFTNYAENNNGDAELLGIQLKGYVGIGAFDDKNYSSDALKYNDAEDIEGVVNTYKGSNVRPYIDIEAEEIDRVSLPFTAACYSLNNGSSWVAGDLTDEKLIAAFNSATIIVLAKEYDSSKKKPKTGSDTVTFMRIEGRPSGNTYKLKLYYTDESWGLVKNYTDTKFADEMDDLWITKADSTGKLPTSPDWKTWDAMSGQLWGDEADSETGNWAGGLPIEDLPAKGVKKTVYFLRTSAYKSDAGKYYPAGKGWKITPATKSKEPSYKVNYKKEILSMKKGESLGQTAYTVKTNVDVTALYSQTVELTKLPTGKKPGSMTQELKIADRNVLQPTTFEVSDKGKITTKLKDYEFWNGSKWGKIPKVTGNTTVKVRLKQNVKVTKGVIVSGGAASLPGTLTITWDSELNKGKGGISSAVIAVDTVDVVDAAMVIMPEALTQEQIPNTESEKIAETEVQVELNTEE